MKALNIFLDESGDLGTKGSQYFVMAAVVLKDGKDNQLLTRAIKKSLKWGIRNSHVNGNELKFSKLSYRMACYFFKKIEKATFDVHGIILKKDVRGIHSHNQTVTYNQVIVDLLKQVNLDTIEKCHITITRVLFKRLHKKRFQEKVYLV